MASADGTRRFAERSVQAGHAASGHFRRADVGLSLSSLGLGTYIGRPDGPTDLAVEHAARVAISSGRVNVLDTAINYRYQRAERSLGRAIGHSLERGVDREELFVATKGGYFAPDSESPIPTSDWVESELIRPGILDPADIVDDSHAMSRSYLADQFERSRTNLGLETIDLYYLHNAADAQLPIVGREEFLRRLREAFRLLEELRDGGRLQWYGLATWDCLRNGDGDSSHLELEPVLGVAKEAGGESHGFRFIQLPFNWAMPEAGVSRTQRVRGRRASAIEAAVALGLGVFTSVPLLQGQLAHRGPRRADASSAQTAIQFARSWPGVLAPLVGQKTVEHLSENLGVAALEPWAEGEAAQLLR